MRNSYVRESTNPISIIPLSTNDGAIVDAVCKLRKDQWYVVESLDKKKIVEKLTPSQFHVAIAKGWYVPKW